MRMPHRLSSSHRDSEDESAFRAMRKQKINKEQNENKDDACDRDKRLGLGTPLDIPLNVPDNSGEYDLTRLVSRS